MAITSLSLLLLSLSLLASPLLSIPIPIPIQSKPCHGTGLPTPYLSPATLFQDYQKMLTTFKIYIYSTPTPFAFTTPPESLFHTSLLNSHFQTQNPDEAHLFFVPFPSHLSARPLSRRLRELRLSLPYWNRTLGADHFFVSRAGITYESDRNLVELKKNSIQISCFPTSSRNFIPHKDITLPPISSSPLALPHAPTNNSARFLGFYYSLDGVIESSLVNDLSGDPEFLIGSEPSVYVEGLEESRFCLFFYDVDVSRIGQALSFGCVPVVITDRPIQDLPLMDVLRWSEIALFVGARTGVKELKKALSAIPGDRYECMRGSGMTAGQHLVWNASPQPHDAFHMVIYQLWLRRHTIRYTRRVSV